MKILVADDDRLSRRILEHNLERWGHLAVCVSSGSAAWQALQQDPSFDLLITDWEMPGLSGVELCRRLRESARSRYLSIILLTSHDQASHLVEALHAGADAFVSKPLNPPELEAQIRVASRVLELENRLARQLHDLREAHQRLHADVEAAAAVQTSLLPKQPPAGAGVEFAWVYDACELLGGDMFNVFRLDEDHVGLYVLDVSGHGVQAALLSVTLSRVLTPIWQQGGILKRPAPDRPYELVSPAEVARELNRRFPLMEQTGHFFTFLYGTLNLRTRILEYVRAGHPGPIHVRGDAALVDDRASGLPVGIFEDAVYEPVELELERGDLVVIHTDGVNETMDASGQEFGTDRMLEVLAGERPSGVAGAVQALRRSVAAFGKGAAQRDDITILGVGLG